MVRPAKSPNVSLTPELIACIAVLVQTAPDGSASEFICDLRRHEQFGRLIPTDSEISRDKTT